MSANGDLGSRSKLSSQHVPLGLGPIRLQKFTHESLSSLGGARQLTLSRVELELIISLRLFHNEARNVPLCVSQFLAPESSHLFYLTLLSILYTPSFATDYAAEHSRHIEERRSRPEAQMQPGSRIAQCDIYSLTSSFLPAEKRSMNH